MAAGDVFDQGAHGRFRRRRRQIAAQRLGGGQTAGQQAHGRALDIALDPGHLAGEAQARNGLQPHLLVQQLRAVQEGVAVQAPQTRELGVLQTRDHAEDVGLGAVLQLGLEADHVEQGAQRIVLTQLHDGVGLDRRVVLVGQADGLHRAVAQGLAAALGHDLDRQAAVEIGDVLPLLEVSLGAVQQGVDEGFVLGLVHRAVDVGRLVAAGAFLVIARLAPGDVEVDAVGVQDRRDGVEEAERFLARGLQDGVGQGGRGQRAGGDDDVVPVFRRNARDLFTHDGHEGMGFQLGRDSIRKADAVNRQGAARRHLIGVAGRHDQAVQRPHLGVQQADGVELPVVRPEGVGADQLGQARGVVGVGPHLLRLVPAHFVQDDGHARLGDLPGRFGSGEASADDVDGAGSGRRVRHGGLIASWTSPVMQRRAVKAVGGRRWSL